MLSYPQCVGKIINLLSSNGFKAYLVGGCVRDTLMGNVPHDFDIASDALPEQIREILKDYKIIPTGLKHGTLTVLSDGMPIEITTFRTDGEYTDSRHPENVAFTRSFREDAMRRDFTVNAMAYSPAEGVIDYFGGRADIEKRLIRCVGAPDERFCEDALRILRALRFASTLGFDIEEDTSRAVRENAGLLKNISAERVRDEFVKLICGNNAVYILMQYSDVIGVFIPEILPMIGFQQHNPHHIYDVWEHTVRAVGSIPPIPYLRLAAFFHDSGKPDTFQKDENGVGHFYGHAEKSCKKACAAMERLRFDRHTEDKVLNIIRYHDLNIAQSPKAVKRCMNKMSPDTFFDVIHMFRADNSAKSPLYASRVHDFDELERIAKDIVAERACFSLASLAVNGVDLINAGIPKGKKIGEMLNCLLELVINEELENDKDVLMGYILENRERFSQ